METLLSHSFDYLSSPSPQKIRKGLRQVEGLLAQICLSKTTPAANKRHSMLALGSTPSASPKRLSELHHDAAFREFYKLQGGFQWNVAMRLIGCLERLLGKGSNGTNDLLIIQTLDLMQGVLLLHPPSRELFAREIHMNIFLDLLDPANCPAIQSCTLLALVTSFLDYPSNVRTFEACDGLLVITSLFKTRATSKEVKMRLVEVLYFYLMPEVQPSRTSASASASATNTAVLGGRGRELVAAFDRRRESTVSVNVNVPDATTTTTGKAGAGGNTKSSEEKQYLLGKYLSNVDDFVEDLKEGPGLFQVGGM